MEYMCNVQIWSASFSKGKQEKVLTIAEYGVNPDLNTVGWYSLVNPFIDSINPFLEVSWVEIKLWIFSICIEL